MSGALEFDFAGVIGNLRLDLFARLEARLGRRDWGDRLGHLVVTDDAGGIVVNLDDGRRRALLGVAIELLEPSGDRPRPIVGPNSHRRIDRGKETRAVAGPVTLGERSSLLTMETLENLGRLFASDALVEHDAKRINVGPRPLRVGFHILFDRRVGRGVEGHRGTRRLCRLETRRTKVDQHRPAIGIDQDVGRLDVAVKNADTVGAVEPLGDRPDHVEQAALVKAGALLQQARERIAVLEIHHHVGGAVHLEQAAHVDDVGVARRGRQVPQQLGFFDELLEAQRVDFLGIGIDRDDGIFSVAFADRTGEIFLDRDQLVEINPASAIDDPESADTQHIFESPLAKDGSWR